MFNYIFEVYNISNYDTRPGAGITMKSDPVLGTTVGGERSMGDIYSKFDDNVSDEIDCEIDDELEHDIEAISKKLYQPVYNVDPKRSTVSHSGGNMRQVGALNEEHTNPIRKGISPYPQKKFTGPAIGGHSTDKSYTTGPPRKTGTLYGTSRAPLDMDETDPLMFGEETPSKYELSFLKFQKKIAKTLNELDNLNKIE